MVCLIVILCTGHPKSAHGHISVRNRSSTLRLPRIVSDRHTLLNFHVPGQRSLLALLVCMVITRIGIHYNWNQIINILLIFLAFKLINQWLSWCQTNLVNFPFSINKQSDCFSSSGLEVNDGLACIYSTSNPLLLDAFNYYIVSKVPLLALATFERWKYKIN